MKAFHPTKDRTSNDLLTGLQKEQKKQKKQLEKTMMMKKITVLLAVALAGLSSINAQENTEDEAFADIEEGAGDIHTMDPVLQAKTTCLSSNYFVSMPEGAHGEKMPLIIYLHGGGSKGFKMKKIDHCIPRLRYGIDKYDKGPCIVVVPQCLAKPADGVRGRWRPADLNIFLENVINTLPVDTDRVYLTGNSMGGSGSWAWGGSNPEHFAAIAPVSGGVGNRGSDEVSPKIEAMAKKLATIPVYAFAGEKDDVVSPENSKRMVAAIKDAGGTQVKLTVYPDAGHGAKGITYKSQAFYDWMFSKTRK